jgi:DNA-binding HxlR family transcriptional regulator
VSEEPRFWGSWKSLVIRSIVLHDVHDFDSIQTLSELSSNILTKVLIEMLELKIVSYNQNNRTYWIIEDLYREYQNYIQHVDIEPRDDNNVTAEVPRERKGTIRQWIKAWWDSKDFPLLVDC